ncbi:hypothetical protein A2852_00480 [Candidatus Adlerbacteria bacterium RIFCSPHIGHO2_01_FULL_54_23]|uniref:Glycosyltransferase RgtA/B/C/D-like domain-containing protein n=3 Tax=Candidatus Adleribacteriota TaxID=1752736 RepID=A0A1F4Y039_9BACT|nr:MAG: hypothetical protein UY83_C0003G0042 [Candidatus Adlerbacteria bacterium GW2011_GWA1_54_10]KKW37499.1 MAG: hypothetical protein UY86_C0007G0008 [Candidatus Adlerbacteria bacterium GW2011_GWB1_54_7]OGC79302.1 MAG: hypothetical protein A2852_00480 [Candidatus Adlerbacteria bacterium RIFCSPHIGHO2_01_FULL_54_23]OGC87340.1 MAG: hypothetical protein A3B33_00105 [Candidatus Adlerbacteria bacterium RIFCSPLOWO2_01_FULL_54_16]
MRFLWIILAMAFALRLASVTFGLPLVLFGDEFVHIVTAFNFLDEGTLRAISPLSYVPSLFAVLLAPFFGIFGFFLMIFGTVDGVAGFKEFAILNAPYFISIGRVLSALFGSAFLFFLFLIVRKITSQKIALAITALAAVDFWLVHESMRAHFWMPATAIVAAGIYFFIRLSESGKTRDYALSTGSMAAGFWMGYFPVLLAPFFALAHFHARGRKLFDLAIWGAISVAALAVVAWLNPLSFLKQFGRAIRSALNVVGIEVFPQFAVSADKATEPLRNFLLFLKLLIFDNPLILVLGLLGMGLMLYGNPRSFKTQVIAGFFLFYLLAGIFVWPHPDNRYILPLLLPLYAAAGYAMYDLFGRGTVARRIVYACAALAFLYSAYASMSYAVLLQKSDTRALAREWIERNAPWGSAVLSDAQYFELVKDKGSVEYLREHLPEALRERDRFAPEDGYFWLNSEYAGKLKDLRFDYFVSGFYDPAAKPEVPQGFSLMQTFYPQTPDFHLDDLLDNPLNPAAAVSAVDRLGPYIEIYSRAK